MRGCSLEAYIKEPGLTEGQRRRLRLFQTVEEAVSRRVERLCTSSEIEVTDAAILVVSPGRAPGVVPDRRAGQRGGAGASVIVDHRARLHEFLHAVLPPTDEAPFDPYVDLLAPSPPQCVRVLIVDEDSLTVLNYGAFVVVNLDRREMPKA